ncbi:MAG: TetR/AcrR family transcriptional regulator [Pseudomonadota bacterium]
MDGGAEDARARRGYHHGNLREALVDAAARLIAERGPQGFTMAEAAREAGVSAAAPYRHFKSREALIAELALRGFDLFADLLAHAWAGGAPSPLAAFERVGRAYLAFAAKEPGYYVSMFESGVPAAQDPALQAASDRAMGVLRAAAQRLADQLPPEKRPPVQMMTYHVWAMSHGVVELFARQTSGQRASISPEDLLESGTMVYLRGLGLIPDDR